MDCEAPSSRWQRLWSLALSFAACVVAISEAWTYRHAMNPDGISYLDISSSILAGQWKDVVNGHWSPMYPALLAVFLRLSNATAAREAAVAHVVNVVIYLGTLVSFNFFARQLLRFRRARTTSTDLMGRRQLQEYPLLALAFCVLIWSSSKFVNQSVVSPDMLVTGFFYLLCGIVVRTRLESPGWGMFAVLGAVAGLGYLAKAPLFPLAFVFIACASLRMAAIRTSLVHAVLAVAGFAAIAGPWVMVLSFNKGRATFGDSARLNYLWYVAAQDVGTARHPLRTVFQAPTVYEFAWPIAGTYPPWRDPSYWREGIIPVFNLEGHLARARESVSIYRGMFVGLLDGTVALSMFLLLWLAAAYRGKRLLGDLAAYGFVLVPPLTGLAMYGVILVEPRYVCGFVVAFVVVVLVAVPVPNTRQSLWLLWGIAAAALIVVLWWVSHGTRWWILLAGMSVAVAASMPSGWHGASWRRTAVAAATLLLVPALAYSAGRQLVVVAPELWRDESPLSPDGAIASELLRLGAQAGEKIAVIGGPCHGLYWPRCARLGIVAEIRADDVAAFWELDATRRAELERVIRTTGARYLVSLKPPPLTESSAWTQIGHGPLYLHVLAE